MVEKMREAVRQALVVLAEPVEAPPPRAAPNALCTEDFALWWVTYIL